MDAAAADATAARQRRKETEEDAHITAIASKLQSSANIQAIIRLRPPKRHETEYIQCNPRVGSQLVLDPPSDAGATLDYTDQFTAVMGSQSSQAELFRVCGLPIVEASLSGRSTCVFAYGQTGSGKTFSMYGAEGGKNPSKLDGLVPGICAELFRRKQELEKRKDFQLALEVCVRARACACYGHPLCPAQHPFVTISDDGLL